eukprot:5978086-Pyramimonas_sp.AAC.1
MRPAVPFLPKWWGPRERPSSSQGAIWSSRPSFELMSRPQISVLRARARDTLSLKKFMTALTAFCCAARRGPDGTTGGGYTLSTVKSKDPLLIRTSPALPMI